MKQTLYERLFQLGVVIVPLAIWPTMRILVLPKLVALALVVAIAYVTTVRWASFAKPSVGRVAVILWLLWMLLCSVRPSHLVTSMVGSYHRLCGWLTWCLVVLWFFRARALLRHANRQVIPDALLATAMLLAVYAIVQRIGLDWISLRSIYGHRSFAIIENPNALAIFLSAVVPITMSRAYLAARTLRARYIGVTTILVLAVVTTGSLSGLMALLSGVSLSLVLMLWPGRQRPAFALVAILLIGAYASPAWAGTLKVTARSRWIIWNTASRAILETPYTGVGVDALTAVFDRRLPPSLVYLQGDVRVDSAHNELLDMALGAGIPGVAGYVAFLAAVYRRAIMRMAKPSPSQRALAAAFSACFAIHVGLAVNFWTISLLWLGATLLAWLDSEPAGREEPVQPAGMSTARLIMAGVTIALLATAVSRPLTADYLLTTLTGDPRADLDTLGHIVELAPSRGYHHLILARAVAATEGPGPAMDHYLHACAAEPDDYTLFAEAGTNAARLHERELSERLLSVALRLTGAQNARVWKAWGDAALYQGDLRRAIVRFQRAIELNETSAEAYLGMAQAYALQGNHVASESALDAVRRLQGAVVREPD